MAKIAPRRVLKWALRGLVAVIVLFGLYASPFFLPYPLFPYHADLAGFSVYSDGQIPDDFELIAEDARRRVEAMELFRGGKSLRIFVCHSQRLFVFLNKWAGKRHSGQALVISVAGNAFFSEVGIESVGRRNKGRPDHSRLEGSWPAALAHEAAHDLMISEVGFWKAKKIPIWKSEGYADYSAQLASITSDPDYDLRERIGVLLDENRWDHPVGFIDRRHYSWQLLVEYLYTEKGLNFEQLLDPGLTEESARNDLMTWYATNSNEPQPTIEHDSS